MSRAAKYTLYIVTRSARHHYPVLMANNGKAMLNEPVTQKQTLRDSAKGLWRAMVTEDTFCDGYHFAIVEISEQDFKAKFPKYAKNAGPKRVKKPITNPVK